MKSQNCSTLKPKDKRSKGKHSKDRPSLLDDKKQLYLSALFPGPKMFSMPLTLPVSVETNSQIALLSHNRHVVSGPSVNPLVDIIEKELSSEFQREFESFALCFDYEMREGRFD